MYLKRTLAILDSDRDPDFGSYQERLGKDVPRELFTYVPRMLLNWSLGNAPDRRRTCRNVGASTAIRTVKLPKYCPREMAVSAHLDRASTLAPRTHPWRDTAYVLDGINAAGRRTSFDSVGEFARLLERSFVGESIALLDRITSAACSGCTATDPQTRPSYHQTIRHLAAPQGFPAACCAPLYQPQGVQIARRTATEQRR
jgi:hypothetical protein